jgi:enoyl-CoA hydratase/carnithine racemase
MGVAEGPLRIDLDGDGIAVITLNRPEKRNALSIELRDELVEALARWHDDPAVKVVVVTGAGETFSAGFDLDEFGRAELAREIFHSSARYHRALWYYPKPIVAAVNGVAVGGGFDLAVLCDLRIASTAASFGHPEIKFGAPPLFTPLRWIVGDGRARDLCLTGRRIEAEEALAMGLVSRIVDPGELVAEASSVAKQIGEAPQQALEMTKRYLTGSAGLGFEESFRMEHDDVFNRLLRGPVGPSQEAG